MKDELPDRYFYSRNRVVKLSQVLRNVLPKKRGENKVNHLVADAWRNVVSKEIHQNTKITEFKRGVLYVNVESAVMIHHLTNFEKVAIIAGINRIIGTKYIDDIRFKTGTIDGR